VAHLDIDRPFRSLIRAVTALAGAPGDDSLPE